MSYFESARNRDTNRVLIDEYGWCEDIVETPMIAAPPKEEPDQESANGRTAVYYNQETEWIVGKSVTVKQ